MVDVPNGGRLQSMARTAEGAVATLLFRIVMPMIGSALLGLVAWNLNSAISMRESVVELRGQVATIVTKLDVQHVETERRISAVETFIATQSQVRNSQVNDLAMRIQHATDKVDDLSDQLISAKSDLKGAIADTGVKIGQLWQGIARVQACMFGKGGPSCLLETHQ